MATRRSSRLGGKHGIEITEGEDNIPGENNHTQPVQKKEKTQLTQDMGDESFGTGNTSQPGTSQELTEVMTDIQVSFGPFPPHLYTGNIYRGVVAGEHMPCLWEASLWVQIRNMVYDSTQGCLWLRMGGDGAIWRMKITTDGSLSPTEGNIQPIIITSDIEDGYGLCLDNKRQLLVICDGNKIKTFDYGGNLNRKVSLTGATFLTAVAFCPSKDIYLVCHSLKKIWEIDASTMKISKKDKGKYWGCVYPWWMIHVEEPLCTTSLGMTGDHRLLTNSVEGSSMKLCFGQGVNYLDTPRDMCWDSRQSLILCDHGNNTLKRNYNDKAMGHWEELLPPERIPGGKPSCVELINDQYLVVSSSEDRPYKLSCFKYYAQNLR